MLVIDNVSFGRGISGFSNLGSKFGDWGMIGSFPLGALFALAFCPYSAVLFFAVLIPLSFKSPGGITLPAIFAVGTGLPVLLFSVLLSFGIAGVSKWVNAISRWEKVIRIIVAVVFIGIGIYYMAQWLNNLFT